MDLCRLIAFGASAAAAAACAGPPQTQAEAKVTYVASFSAEQGVNTRVVFPFPLGAAGASVQAGLSVSDGGTARVETEDGGTALALEGRGTVVATFEGDRVQGFGEGSGIPEVALSGEVPDAGTEVRYLRVNKGGSSTAEIDFEFSAGRDCGGGCGGQRAWSFNGPVGLGLQPVSMTYSEEKKR